MTTTNPTNETRKPRLLISTDGYIPRWDGVARFLYELIPHLQKEFDITVIAPAFKGNVLDLPDVRVVRLPLLPIQFGDIYFAQFKRSIVDKLVAEADVVFNQSIGPIGIMTINAAHRRKVPCVSYIHMIEWELAAKSIKRGRRLSSYLTKRLARNLYNKCWMLLVPGEDAELLLQSAGVHTMMKTVPLGVDTGRFAPPIDKRAAKSAIGIAPTAPVVGYVGRIAREKDLPTLQHAFDTVRRDHKNAVLLIVGDGLREELRKGENVRITGMVNNVVPYLQAMDVFVLPSLTETSSLATMEAMSCALPVIVTPVGNIPDYLDHEKNGWFVARRDADDLARKISYLFDRADVRARLSLGARQTMIARYSWSTVSERVGNILHAMLSKKRANAQRADRRVHDARHTA